MGPPVELARGQESSDDGSIDSRLSYNPPVDSSSAAPLPFDDLLSQFHLFPAADGLVELSPSDVGGKGAILANKLLDVVDAGLPPVVDTDMYVRASRMSLRHALDKYLVYSSTTRKLASAQKWFDRIHTYYDKFLGAVEEAYQFQSCVEVCISDVKEVDPGTPSASSRQARPLRPNPNTTWRPDTHTLIGDPATSFTSNPTKETVPACVSPPTGETKVQLPPRASGVCRTAGLRSSPPKSHKETSRKQQSRRGIYLEDDIYQADLSASVSPSPVESGSTRSDSTKDCTRSSLPFPSYRLLERQTASRGTLYLSPRVHKALHIALGEDLKAVPVRELMDTLVLADSDTSLTLVTSLFRVLRLLMPSVRLLDLFLDQWVEVGSGEFNDEHMNWARERIVDCVALWFTKWWDPKLDCADFLAAVEGFVLVVERDLPHAYEKLRDSLETIKESKGRHRGEYLERSKNAQAHEDSDSSNDQTPTQSQPLYTLRLAIFTKLKLWTSVEVLVLEHGWCAKQLAGQLTLIVHELFRQLSPQDIALSKVHHKGTPEANKVLDDLGKIHWAYSLFIQEIFTRHISKKGAKVTWLGLLAITKESIELNSFFVASALLLGLETCFAHMPTSISDSLKGGLDYEVFQKMWTQIFDPATRKAAEDALVESSKPFLPVLSSAFSIFEHRRVKGEKTANGDMCINLEHTFIVAQKLGDLKKAADRPYRIAVNDELQQYIRNCIPIRSKEELEKLQDRQRNQLKRLKNEQIEPPSPLSPRKPKLSLLSNLNSLARLRSKELPPLPSSPESHPTRQIRISSPKALKPTA